MGGFKVGLPIPGLRSLVEILKAAGHTVSPGCPASRLLKFLEIMYLDIFVNLRWKILNYLAILELK